MKKHRIGWLVIFAWLVLYPFAFGIGAAPPGHDKVIKGAYLGQPFPGEEPELFAPGVVSTGLEELNAVFFPGGREIIWSIQYGSMRWALVGMKETGSGWTEPVVLPFSGLYSDVDACISPDGQRIWFSSNRPAPGTGNPSTDFDIWYVERTDAGWGEPVNPGPPINSSHHEFFPCEVNSGAVYFQSHRPGGPGAADIYCCRLKEGRFQPAVPLPEPINNSGFQGDTYVAPDESYAIVSTTPMGVRGWSDLFVSFRQPDGSWGELVNLGPEINSPLSENTPVVTPDGKYLFFKSRKRDNTPMGKHPLTLAELRRVALSPGNGNGDIYWVSTRVLQRLKTLRENKPPRD